MISLQEHRLRVSFFAVVVRHCLVVSYRISVQLIGPIFKVTLEKETDMPFWNLGIQLPNNAAQKNRMNEELIYTVTEAWNHGVIQPISIYCPPIQLKKME